MKTKKEILEEQIDWDRINKIKKDPKKWEQFKREGRQLYELMKVLQEIKQQQS